MKYLFDNRPFWLGLLGLGLMGLLAVLPARPARAAEPPASSAEPAGRSSVVLSPRFQVFADADGRRPTAKLSRAFYRGAAAYGAHHPDQMYVVSRSDLVRAVKTSRGFDWRLQNAQLATELGIDNYKKLAVDKATTHLESALKTYQALHYGLAEPKKVAEVALYLALSYLEQGDTRLRLFNLLQTMIVLDPSRQILEGYYPDNVVRVYRSARNSLVDVLRKEGPQKAAANDLAEFADTDYVVSGYVWPTDHGTHRVALYVYSRRDARFLKPATLEVDTLDKTTLRRAGNRLMSRVAPRTLRPAATAVAGAATGATMSPLSLQFGFAYTSFWQYPYDARQRTKAWGNYGLSVLARYLFTPELGVVVGADILNSIRDYGGFLFDDLTTFRGFVGGDLGTQLADFNLGIQLAVEAATLSEFRACPDVDALCAARDQRAQTVPMTGNSLLLGVNVRPRVAWRAYHQFSLIGSFSASYYVVPLSERDFNVPITGQLGVSYRF